MSTPYAADNLYKALPSGYDNMDVAGFAQAWIYECRTLDVKSSIYRVIYAVTGTQFYNSQVGAMCILISNHFKTFRIWTIISATLHNYRFRQFHRTFNAVNLSIGIRDIHSAKSGARFDKFLAHGQAHKGKRPWHCTTSGLNNSIELRLEKIHLAV